jgi:hypothetical protein
MKYKFSETLEQYYPFSEKPVKESADGFDLYAGDLAYRLDGTDELFVDREEFIQYIFENYVTVEEVENDGD